MNIQARINHCLGLFTCAHFLCDCYFDWSYFYHYSFFRLAASVGNHVKVLGRLGYHCSASLPDYHLLA